ncbi:MAG: hypothetical protein AAFR84_21205 [Pseudomonadota bacterium]
MRTRVRSVYSPGDEPRELESVIRESLEVDEYEKGQIEAARATADNCAEMTARVTAALVDKGILTLDDIGLWGYEEADPL